MAEQLTKVDFYTALVANKPGEAARALAAVRDAGVNLLGILGYKTSARQGELVLVPEAGGAAMVKALRKLGLEVLPKQRALMITGDDQPGAVAALLEKLAAAGVNVIKGHALCGGMGRYGAMIVVAPEHMQKAVRALGIK